MNNLNKTDEEIAEEAFREINESILNNFINSEATFFKIIAAKFGTDTHRSKLLKDKNEDVRNIAKEYMKEKVNNNEQ